MALSTYSELQTAVGAWLRRTDLSSQIPDFITLAEAQMNRRIRSRRKVIRATSTIAGEFLDLPDDFGGVRSFQITSSTPRATVGFITPEQMAGLKDGRTDLSGTPEFYTVVGLEFEFDTVTADDLDCQITYTQRIEALGASNPSNWVLADHPDAYLYGALLQAVVYLKDDARASEFASIFATAIDDINAESLAESHGGMLNPTAGSAVV